MVLRPIELDAARNPQAGEADERRLDHVLAVEEVIVVVGLVLADVFADWQLRGSESGEMIVKTIIAAGTTANEHSTWVR